jgi:hypothetical protein
MYALATDKSADPTYQLAQGNANDTYTLANQEEDVYKMAETGGPEDMYAIATDKTADPLYGTDGTYSTAVAVNNGGDEDTYAIATDKSADPLYGVDDDGEDDDGEDAGEEETYAIATDKTAGPLYGMGDSKRASETYAAATDHTGDALYGMANSSARQSVQYETGDDPFVLLSFDCAHRAQIQAIRRGAPRQQGIVCRFRCLLCSHIADWTTPTSMPRLKVSELFYFFRCLFFVPFLYDFSVLFSQALTSVQAVSFLMLFLTHSLQDLRRSSKHTVCAC